MKRGSGKKKAPVEQPLNLALADDTADGIGMDEVSDPFQEISLLASSMRPAIPIDQIPGPARASRAAPIIENPPSVNDSDSVDDDESVRSEDFNNLMNQYQSEFRGKNQNYASRLPKGVNYLLGEANRLYLEKDFSHSIEVCHEAIKIYPENPEPYHLLSVGESHPGDLRRIGRFGEGGRLPLHRNTTQLQVGHKLVVQAGRPLLQTAVLQECRILLRQSS